VPARTALAAWHATIKPYGRDATEEEARGVARRLGAGGVVLGTIVTAPGRLILNGSLLDVQRGRPRAEAQVEGVPDSLLSLIDQFAARLAALNSGERADRLASLTSTSLPALYAYLAGKATYRAGRYDAAARHFEQALGLDSTFALAAMGVGVAAGWASVDPREHERSMRLAWTYRDRLGPRERVFLDALAGPRYPAPPQPRERIQVWEEAVRQVPDDPDLWTNLGDAYFHDGALADVEEPLQRAAEAFDRALALDPALNVEPAIHLMQIAAMEGDTAKVRRLVSRIGEDDTASAYLRLEAGAVLGDSAMLAAARTIVDSTGSNVGQLLGDARAFGFAIQEAERSAGVYLKRWRPDPRPWPAIEIFNFYHQLGRPAQAAAALAKMVPEEAPASNITFVLVHAILGYVGPAVATKVLARLIPLLDDAVPRDSSAREEQYNVLCVVEWWRLVHGDTRTARAVIRRLAGDRRHCGVLLEALLASAEHRADADAAFGQLDTLLLTGEGRSSWIMPVVRWREAQGDVRRALRTVRRCVRYGRTVNVSNCLREEGHLAELVGDREGAIKAYSHYLALRYNPEPAVKPEVDQVRAELARLVGEPR